MLKIPNNIIEEIYQQGRDEAPIEACGYLGGVDGVVSKRYPMTNVDQSNEHFTLDPKEQFAVMKESRNEGLGILAVYHTHPETPARPSDEDIKLAFDPNIIYVIASLMNDTYTIKAFKIVNGEVTNLPIEVEG